MSVCVRVRERDREREREREKERNKILFLCNGDEQMSLITFDFEFFIDFKH